jgi:hypothetical protein
VILGVGREADGEAEVRVAEPAEPGGIVRAGGGGVAGEAGQRGEADRPASGPGAFGGVLGAALGEPVQERGGAAGVEHLADEALAALRGGGLVRGGAGGGDERDGELELDEEVVALDQVALAERVVVEVAIERGEVGAAGPGVGGGLGEVIGERLAAALLVGAREVAARELAEILLEAGGGGEPVLGELGHAEDVRDELLGAAGRGAGRAAGGDPGLGGGGAGAVGELAGEPRERRAAHLAVQRRDVGLEDGEQLLGGLVAPAHRNPTGA